MADDKAKMVEASCEEGFNVMISGMDKSAIQRWANLDERIKSMCKAFYQAGFSDGGCLATDIAFDDIQERFLCIPKGVDGVDSVS